MSLSLSSGYASSGSGKPVAKRAASSSSGMEAGLLSFFQTARPASFVPRLCQKERRPSSREGRLAGTTFPAG